MADQTITCPRCGHEYAMSDALSGRIRETLRVELEAGVREREVQLKQQADELQRRQQQLEGQVEQRIQQERERLIQEATRQADEQYGQRLQAAELELETKREQIKLAQQKELALARRERELDEEKARLELASQQALAEARRQIEAEWRGRQEELLARERESARRLATEENAQRLAAAEQELADKRAQLAEAHKLELELRKKERELAEQRETLDLEISRKLNEERGRLMEEAALRAQEQQQLKLREKEDLIRAMQERIHDLQRKAEVGSQERQGEALEEELIELLKKSFRFDDFEEVKKGVRGADILQRVRAETGRPCGAILWESKNSRNFNRQWIDKLKQDQQESGAELAVLMTMTLPPEVKGFGLYDDVWVTDFSSAVCLCIALRQLLMQVDRERLVALHQETMKDVIYKYITGQDFVQRVKAVVGAYQQMQTDLSKEKTAMQKIWSQRQKQIERVLTHTTIIYGELQGLLGGGEKALPPVDLLELESIVEE